MSPILSRIYQSEGGTEALDVLMKYVYALPHLAYRKSRMTLAIPLFEPKKSHGSSGHASR